MTAGEPGRAATPIVAAEGIAVRYRNGAMGVHDVTVGVNAGEVVAICGPNGAGKTTTVRALTGFLRTEGTRVVSGRVSAFGHDVTNREPHDVNRLGVYLIPERRKVFANLTVAENLSSLGHAPSRAERNLRMEQIRQLFPPLPGLMSQRAGRLSGGQQQMLAIARALMTDAKILVVDEVALGLHPSLLAPIFKAIRAIAIGDRAAIIVNEDIRSARSYADRYYCLENGVVIGKGVSGEAESDRLGAPA